MEGLYHSMFNQRLYELTQVADPPYLGAFSGQGRWVRTKEVFMLGAGVADNGFDRGLEALLTEAARIRRFGFTRSELAREKKNMLRGMEQAYRERDKSQSSGFAAEYVRQRPPFARRRADPRRSTRARAAQAAPAHDRACRGERIRQ